MMFFRSRHRTDTGDFIRTILSGIWGKRSASMDAVIYNSLDTKTQVDSITGGKGASVLYFLYHYRGDARTADP